MLDIYTKQLSIKEYLDKFISRVENKIDSFSSIYNTVIVYNKEYGGYVKFLDKMLRMKLKLLKERYK